MIKKYETYKTDWEEVLLDSLKQKNNLVVTTKCNLNCLFCSRKYNPFKCEHTHRHFNDIKAQMELLNPNLAININNSISRTTDGEPFYHPKIWDILDLLRTRFPFCNLPRLNDKISITTNGTFLTDSVLKKLEELGGIIIIHSINSTDVNDYMKISQTSRDIAKVSTSVPERIKDFKIPYIPSIVALPNLIGFESIENTLRDLNKHNIDYARIFLPTYTKYASENEQRILYCDYDKFYSLIERLKKELKMKILLYPTIFKDLKPSLEGYEYLGINPTDNIISVDGVKPFSRWDAQKLISDENKKSHIVELKDESGSVRKIEIPTEKITISNYVNTSINRDLPDLTQTIKKITKGFKKVLVVPSQIGANIVREAFNKIKERGNLDPDTEFYFQTAYNDFYGGSVMSGGLLTCQDYRKYIKKFIDENFKPDLILVSGEAFDILGRDLLKESIFDVMDGLDVKIRIVFLKRVQLFFKNT